MADEDDAVALVAEPAQDGEDLLRLLGREDGGRLVEDQDPGLAIEGLEDLDPLLPADRQATDLLVRVDLETESLAELADAPTGLGPVEEDRVGHRLVAQQDVLGDGEDRHEHEVLVDHADAAGDGVGRAGDLDRLAVEQDLALVRRGEAVEDVHQRGLARAVLAEQRVDLARADGQVDVVVGQDARVALGDAAHLERRGDHRRRSGRALQPSRHSAPGCVRAGRHAVCRPARLMAGGRVRIRLVRDRAAAEGVLVARLERAGLHGGDGRVDLGLDVGRDEALRSRGTATGRRRRS